MNIFLWILQILLAVHTLFGAMWKITNSEQSEASLKVIPHDIWIVMSIIELICAISLILPLINKRLGIMAPIASFIIALEMQIFSGLLIFSVNPNYGHLIYWLIVAALSGFITYSRLVLKPIKRS